MVCVDVCIVIVDAVIRRVVTIVARVVAIVAVIIAFVNFMRRGSPRAPPNNRRRRIQKESHPSACVFIGMFTVIERNFSVIAQVQRHHVHATRMTGLQVSPICVV